MSKKGQGQLVAYVLLIGFTVVLGVMVGGWMIRQAGKTGEKNLRGSKNRRAKYPAGSQRSFQNG